MIALVDCNNFYASCEQVFQPKLRNQAVVVLSNNDGCVISRSVKAKELGIKMGAPFFKLDKDVANKLVAFSPNFTLYGTFSNRIVNILTGFCPEIEVYSIDESFLELTQFEKYQSIYDYLQTIRQTVLEWSNITVSIGLSHTKTLAKVANKLAKKMQTGICILKDSLEIESALKSFDVGDIWGVGFAFAKKLKSERIYTAYDLTRISDIELKKRYNVNILRTKWELLGKPCIGFEENPPKKQTITCSRSFGQNITELKDLIEATATFTERVAEKLRKQKSCAGGMSVFVMTNPFMQTEQYYKTIHIQFPVLTSDNLTLIKYAIIGLKHIFKPNLKYKKAGVIMDNIYDETVLQQSLFQSLDSAKGKSLMSVIDDLNGEYGKRTVHSALSGVHISNGNWKMRQERRSPDYTTKWTDLLKV